MKVNDQLKHWRKLLALFVPFVAGFALGAMWYELYRTANPLGTINFILFWVAMLAVILYCALEDKTK